MPCPHYSLPAEKAADDDTTYLGDFSDLSIVKFTVHANMCKMIYRGCTCDACDPYYCNCVRRARGDTMTSSFDICYLASDYYDDDGIEMDVDRIFDKYLTKHVQSLTDYHVDSYSSSHITCPVPISKIMNNKFRSIASGDLIVDLTGMRFMDSCDHRFKKVINPYD